MQPLSTTSCRPGAPAGPGRSSACSAPPPPQAARARAARGARGRSRRTRGTVAAVPGALRFRAVSETTQAVAAGLAGLAIVLQVGLLLLVAALLLGRAWALPRREIGRAHV